MLRFFSLILIMSLLSACSQPQPEPAAEPAATGAAPGAAPTPASTPTPVPTPTPTPEWEREGWTLIWQDEFEGEAIDPTRWELEIGGHGWGNNEPQFYTDRPENARIEAGQLVIEAREEEFVRRKYTSARLKTQGLFAFTYGRAEARMKLPQGQGIWPAFWMLGENITEVPWPASGEIDIMEHIGREPTRVYGTVHGPGYSGSGGVGHFITLPAGSLYEEFHVFAVEWEPEEIRWYVDDREFFKLTPEQVRGEWVYDHPFFLLINLAVGGNWPGYPNETTVFPQYLTVDYVRVYQRPELAGQQTARQGGSMHLGEITASAESSGTGWQASVVIKVVDQDGQPVENAKVSGGWVGIVTKGESSGLTDAAGELTLLSDPTEREGQITFCVTSITRSGTKYDKSANPRSCAKVER
jgi:beta-glucanase (GH16 family)